MCPPRSPLRSAPTPAPGSPPRWELHRPARATPRCSGFPTSLPTYGLLTSGNAELADDANTSNSSGAGLGLNDPFRGDARDSQTLRINFNVPAGNTCLLLDYKFFSEEFPEFVDKGFNDGFVAELDATSWQTSNQKINAPADFAGGYGDQVSVDTVGPTVVAAANSAGTTYDAATSLITTKTPITAGSPHRLPVGVRRRRQHLRLAPSSSTT